MYMRSASLLFFVLALGALLRYCVKFTRLAVPTAPPGTGRISSGSEPGSGNCALAPGRQLLLVHAFRAGRGHALAAQNNSRQSDLRQAGRVALAAERALPLS